MRSLFKQSDDKLSKRMDTMEANFSKIFNNLRDEIASVKNDLTSTNEKVTSISSRVDDIEKSLTFQTDKLNDVEKAQDKRIKDTNKALIDKIDMLNNKLLLLEKYDRKYNLLFFGIPETPNENVYQKLRDIFVTDMGLDEDRIQNMYFAHGHRLPSKGDGPRPIILRFTSYDDREHILANAKKLAGSRRRILVDLPVGMKKERDRLAKIAYGIRHNEQLQTRIRDRGLDLYLQVRGDENEQWVKRDV